MTRSLMHQKLNEHVQVSMHTIKHMYTRNIQDGGVFGHRNKAAECLHIKKRLACWLFRIVKWYTSDPYMYENYVNIQHYHVNIHHNYVNMQQSYASMLDNLFMLSFMQVCAMEI